MQNVPNIVKERLKSAAITVDHPDADVLTAFSERALADRERGQVLEHLARCAQCREVVALALPAGEPTLAAVRPVRGRWLTWPRLRWGLVAAGLIVVGSFGVLRHERARDAGPVALQSARTDALPDEAKNRANSLPARSEEVSAQKSPSTPAAESPDVAPKPKFPEAKKESDAISLVAKSQVPQDEKAAASGGRTTVFRSQTLPHGPMAPTQWQQNLNANASNQRNMYQSQPLTPGTREPALNDHAATGMMASAQSSPAPAPPVGGPVQSEKQTLDLDTLAMHRQSAMALPATRGNSGAEVARAKDAEPPITNTPKSQAVGAYEVSPTSTSNFSLSGTLESASLRWAINSTGGLQRSFDQGKTWQIVDVNSSARDSNELKLQLAMKSSPAKTAAKDKADAKSKPIIFRAVASNGPDVWAGGSETMLFHSTDSGDHWIRIQPSWRGVQLSGDILSLQFADPQHGRIVTSTAEIWTTADAGQTWDKQ